MLGILCGLQSLEEKGVLHGDFKPDNIMLSQASGMGSGSLHVKICDFGLACYSDVDRYLYTRSGTPGYVSPEVLKAVSKDAAFRLSSTCDTFSAGVILYLMLTGSHPLQGCDVKEVLIKTAQCEVDFSQNGLDSQLPEMLHLLRGLLMAAPELRLTASKALGLPVFDNVRDTQLPMKAIGRVTGTHDSDLETDLSARPLQHSILSLEGGSIIRETNNMEEQFTLDASAFSIRMQSCSSMMSRSHQAQIRKASSLNKYAYDSIPRETLIGQSPPLLPCLKSTADSNKILDDNGTIPIYSSQNHQLIKKS